MFFSFPPNFCVFLKRNVFPPAMALIFLEILHLHPDIDQGLVDRLHEINRTLSGQLGRLRNIQKTVADTENLAEQARSRVDDTAELIKTASDKLSRASAAVAKVVSLVLGSESSYHLTEVVMA